MKKVEPVKLNNDDYYVVFVIVFIAIVIGRYIYFQYSYPEIVSGRYFYGKCYTMGPFSITGLLLSALDFFQYLFSPDMQKKFVMNDNLVAIIVVLISLAVDMIAFHFLKKEFSLMKAYSVYQTGVLTCGILAVVFLSMSERKKKRNQTNK